MTQIAVSEEFADNINTLAANRGCSPEELMQSIVVQLESDEDLAERMLTPALQKRMLDDLARVERGEFVTSEDVDRKFETLFRELSSR